MNERIRFAIYDSALRWQRSTRFFAERGMASGDQWMMK
jgi:hypothetical protein